jgi:hypothetical protein
LQCSVGVAGIVELDKLVALLARRAPDLLDLAIPVRAREPLSDKLTRSRSWHSGRRTASPGAKV